VILSSLCRERCQAGSIISRSTLPNIRRCARGVQSAVIRGNQWQSSPNIRRCARAVVKERATDMREHRECEPSESHSIILAIALNHDRNRTQSYSQSHSIALGSHYRHLAEEFIAPLFGAHAHLMRGAIREHQRRSSPFGRGPLDEGRNQRGQLDEGRNQRGPRVVPSSLAISMHAAAPTRRKAAATSAAGASSAILIIKSAIARRGARSSRLHWP
jgi:hypothetical protein